MANQANGTGDEMGFVAHLIELRDRLLRMVLAIGIVFLILMPFAQDLYNLLSDPLVRHLPKGQTLIAVGVASPFFIPYKLALMLAFVLALPYVLHQMWGFIAPGLYQHEKRLVTPLLLSSVILFYLGMAFAYFFVLPMIFSILPGFAPSNVAVTPDISEYLDFVLMMFIAFGIGFEMPVATVLIISTGMMSREDLIKSRPYVIVIAFTVGMFLTPPDVLSQVMLAVPMWMLFELGLVVSKVFEQYLRRSAAEHEAAEQAEEAAYAGGAVGVLAAAGAAAAASASTAASVRSGEDVESLPMWEDDRYSYEETIPSADGDASAKPMTDEEMEAEMARIEAELADLDEQGRYAAGNNPPPPPV